MIDILRNAIEAKIAYWDAMNELEEALGFPAGDIPDKLNNDLIDFVEGMAVSFDDMSFITEEHVEQLKGLV